MISHLVQLLLPVRDNNNRPIPDSAYEEIKRELVIRYGGVTAFTRAPAEGVWAASSGARQEEDVVIVEVMTPDLDTAWWGRFRKQLEKALGQEEIVVRAFPIRILK